MRTFRTLPLFSLENKTCVVTGSARGLGKEFLTAFALSGARGACVDLSQKDGDASISSITSQVEAAYPNEPVPDLRAYQCDVTVESQVRSTWAQIVKDFGQVDVLVTAAGIVDNVEAENYEYNRWRKMMDINVDGSWLFAREAGKHMLENSIRGSIVLIASMSGKICVRPQKQAAYNASKGAIKILAKSLATEWAPRGIRVNSLSPGYVKTDLIDGLLEHEGRELVKDWNKDIPFGRMANPDELNGTIVWMASNASSYLTGSDVIADGGYTCVGGGSRVRSTPSRTVGIGPQSVSKDLTTKARVFGDSVLTTTDIIVAAGLQDIGDRSLVSDISPELVVQAEAQVKALVETVVDEMKTSEGDIPVILVGGGSIICPNSLDGVSKILRPAYSHVANAVGAAMAKVSGQVDTIVTLTDVNSEKEAIAWARSQAITKARERGADDPEIVEETILPVPSVTTRCRRIIVRAGGKLSNRFHHFLPRGSWQNGKDAFHVNHLPSNPHVYSERVAPEPRLP
ncbi:Fc.00g114300.m01.CDS01 [Cosmosporella sp. VM-42]